MSCAKSSTELSYAVYKATKNRATRRSGRHRTLTHTWLWAVLIGGGTSVLAITGSRWAVLAILFVHAVLAIENLLWRATALQQRRTGVAAGRDQRVDPRRDTDRPDGGADWLFTAPGQEYLCWGCLSCSVRWCTTSGALTVSGCPILWPIPVGRKLVPHRSAEGHAVRAGGWVELKVLMPAFMLLGEWAARRPLNFI